MISGRQRRAIAGGCMVRLLVLLVALLAFVALGWMLLLPVVVTNQIRSRTGFEATVASLSCNAFTGRLTIRGLVLTNPPTFPTSDFLQLREFHAVGDIWSLFSGPITLDELVLDVRRLAIVKRADGRSNVELLTRNLGLSVPAPVSASRPPVTGSAAPIAAPSSPAPRKFHFRKLTLRVDQLMLADYSGTKPDVHEYRLTVDQRYENVTDAKQLLVPDVLRKVAAEDLGPGLGRLVPGDFGRALGEAAREAALSGEVLLKDAGGKAKDLFRGLREKLEESKKP